jgi:hypothetical protein
MGITEGEREDHDGSAIVGAFFAICTVLFVTGCGLLWFGVL